MGSNPISSLLFIYNMLLTILLLPLLGFFSGLVFGKQLGKGVPIITTLLTFLSFILSFTALIDVITTGNSYIVFLKEWIRSGNLLINWSFCFDSLTCVMIVVVTFISSLVHLYSTEYMENDPHLTRFMSYLSLFTFFMLILVTADNFLQMFVGWEGVGVSSYLLINFWFTRIQANKAAIKAMLVNRVGDFFLLLAMFEIYSKCGSLDYSLVFDCANNQLCNAEIVFGRGFEDSLPDFVHEYGLLRIKSINFICLFLFFGAMGKSAQIGLHTWLPDAMEGPTPVSALIHAATMVTAGVFLICRCSALFENAPDVLSFITVVGAMTAFFAATTGLYQNDMKKVIAYSTCSQLGYMIFACGLSSYDVGMFHLSNHAFFKALLFLGAGAVIHAVSDEQDMRKMGGLKNILPFTYSVILIGSLALIGFPFLAGFYSKDVILEVSASTYTTVGLFSYILGILAAFCTAFYSTRLLFLVFLANPNGNKKVILNAHEGGWRLSFPLFILAFLSIVIGYVSKDLFIGFGSDFWGSAIFIKYVNYTMTDIEFLDLKYKLLPLIVTLLGTFSAYFINIYGMGLSYRLKQFTIVKNLYVFFNKKWFFDRRYNQKYVQKWLDEGYDVTYQHIDRGILETFGPYGIGLLVESGITKFKSIQSGDVQKYLKYIAAHMVVVILIFGGYAKLAFLLMFIIFYINLSLKYVTAISEYLKKFVEE